MSLDVKVENNRLVVGNHLTLTFQRTLRIPDDGNTYPLPPGLGAFPIRRVDDYADRVPPEWTCRGGVLIPMYQREAMWLNFSAGLPHAVKVGVGKVCALTGQRWTERLRRKPQNYIVAPNQPWLDGICAARGRIRQFVAMPLGQGYTVEGQVTGEERFGGVQLKVFAPKPGRLVPPPSRSRCVTSGFSEGMASFGAGAPMAQAMPAPGCAPAPCGRSAVAADMGLGAGGRMKQKIYPDPHGLQTWDEQNTARLFVHIVNSQTWREITGESPPQSPVTAKEYERHGLPWFDLYDDHSSTLKPSRALKGVKSVTELDAERFASPQMDDEPVSTGAVQKLWHAAKGFVRDGQW